MRFGMGWFEGGVRSVLGRERALANDQYRVMNSGA